MAELDDTKSRLLEAAGEEFAQLGFEGATIRGIIRRACANVAAVNYHFGDKENLYVQAVLEAHRGCMSQPAEVVGGEATPAERLRGQIHAFLRNVLAVGQHESWHHRLTLREMMRPGPASTVLVREAIRPRFDELREVVRLIRPDLDERELNATVFSIVGQCLHYKMARPIAERLVGAEAFARMDLDFLTGHITGFTLAALGVEEPSAAEAR